MTEYAVHFIADDALPVGHDWCFVRVDQHEHLFIKESRVCPVVLGAAWGAWQRMPARVPVSV